MLPTIQTVQPSSLRAHPLLCQLTEPHSEAWRLKINAPFSQGRLLRWKGNLYLHLPDKRFFQVEGAVAPDETSLAPWPQLEVKVVYIGLSFASEAVFIGENQVVYRWQPGSAPIPAWEEDDKSNTEIVRAFTLPQNRLIIQVLIDGQWQIRLVEHIGGGLRWQRNGTIFNLICEENAVTIISSLIGGSITKYNLATGAIMWQSAAPNTPISDVIGRIDHHLWLATQGGMLHGYSLKSGEKVTQQPVAANIVPGGILSQDGLYYCCNGLNLGIYDLRSGAELRSFSEFPRQEEMPTTTSGKKVLLNETGELYFFDDKARLYVLNPEDPSQPKPLYQAATTAIQYQAEKNHLIALCEDGTLLSLTS